ncbi:hypothetical protein [Actinoplanes xinjiangensis]|uniref:hypothetical protein n=1 Tax=Actinoplanes xinjiangensis TaxID=512350 RepID=UPI000D6C016C|nr:hypothetical protein [Actinoplanes xinjiangensis]
MAEAVAVPALVRDAPFPAPPFPVLLLAGPLFPGPPLPVSPVVVLPLPALPFVGAPEVLGVVISAFPAAPVPDVLSFVEARDSLPVPCGALSDLSVSDGRLSVLMADVVLVEEGLDGVSEAAVVPMTTSPVAVGARPLVSR